MPVFDLGLIKAAMLAGVLGLDASAFMQLMLARPLVAGWLVGMVCGDALAGLAMGSLLELLYGGMLPVGAYVPPDYLLATAVTVAGTLRVTAVLGPSVPFEAVMASMMLLGFGAAKVGGWAEVWLRRLNVVLAHWAEKEVMLGRESALGTTVAVALFLQFLKTAALVALILAIVVPVLGRLLADLPAPILLGLARMSWLTLVLGLAVMADLFWNRRLAPLMFGSFGVSWLLVHVLLVPTLWMVALVIAAGAAAALLWRPAQA
jgi:PTS system mannose-specific IIC component